MAMIMRICCSWENIISNWLHWLVLFHQIRLNFNFASHLPRKKKKARNISYLKREKRERNKLNTYIYMNIKHAYIIHIHLHRNIHTDIKNKNKKQPYIYIYIYIIKLPVSTCRYLLLSGAPKSTILISWFWSDLKQNNNKE